jgi:hypothetical protein
VPAPGATPPVTRDVVDPADQPQIAELSGLLRTGRADLYGQDEADLALLPTLMRTWMPRGAQLKVRAPGTNEKCSVSAGIDLAAGALLWRTDKKRNAAQFCDTLRTCADRSIAHGRVAVVLTDNAPGHRVGKTGIVRRALDALAGQVVIVFQPKYSPELQPTERLWRQWRPNVTHNHRRDQMADLQADSDNWLGRMAADPDGVLQALGRRVIPQATEKAA